MYGSGQSLKSLLSQLDHAIDEGMESFDMSPGDQLRDYLPVEAIACRFARVIAQREVTGVINCCSGRPISAFQLVENILRPERPHCV